MPDTYKLTLCDNKMIPKTSYHYFNSFRELNNYLKQYKKVNGNDIYHYIHVFENIDITK